MLIHDSLSAHYVFAELMYLCCGHCKQAAEWSALPP